MHQNRHSEAIAKLENAQRLVGHSRSTRIQYAQWVIRYRESRMAGTSRDLQTYLTRLATVEKVNPKTVRQCLNALKFYHEKVLGIQIEPNSLEVPRINKNRNVPVWLTHVEAMDMIGRITGTARLQAEMLYGTGGRITALITLRLKDIDIGRALLTYRFDKGVKSRTVRLPQSILPRLTHHIESVRQMWEHDQPRGIIYPTDDHSLMRKLGRARFGTLPFCWLFPSRDIRGTERWHGTDKPLSDAIRKAAAESGITKRVTPHTFRHSDATSLLDCGENIRTLQDHLGHADVKTTEIYTHARATYAVISPMDRLSSIA